MYFCITFSVTADLRDEIKSNIKNIYTIIYYIYVRHDHNHFISVG